jgi:hypothetical protein
VISFPFFLAESTQKGRTPMFRIIRAGIGFSLVILVSPEDAGPDNPDAKLYRYATWEIEGNAAGAFHEISIPNALGYFSGIADGLGFEKLPKEPFISIEEALSYVISQQHT